MFYYVTFSLLFVLKLIWIPLEFLLLPLLYLGDFIIRCLLAPFRFLAKFEVYHSLHDGEGYGLLMLNRHCTSTWA